VRRASDYAGRVTPTERSSLLQALAEHRGGELKSFFVAHGLGSAFENERNRGDSKRKKIADAIDVAERRDGDDSVLIAAAGEFGLGDLLAASVAPGLVDLVADLAQHADWVTVQEVLTAAAAEACTDPAGAITASRSAIESVCKHICDERHIEYKDSDDLSTLYKKVARTLNLAPEQHSDDGALRQTLQGAVTVIAGLAALRNAFGDAHGKGKGAPGTPEAFAILAVNMATGITRLLLDAHDH
jgi:Abortive infection C-terminus